MPVHETRFKRFVRVKCTRAAQHGGGLLATDDGGVAARAQYKAKLQTRHAEARVVRADAVPACCEQVDSGPEVATMRKPYGKRWRGSHFLQQDLESNKTQN